MTKTYNYVNPSTLMLHASQEDLDIIDKFYTYKDLKAEQLYKRHMKNHYLRAKMGHEEYMIKSEELKTAIMVHLLDWTDEGDALLLSGFAGELESKFGFQLAGSKPVNAHEADLGNWPVANENPHEPRYYQVEAVKALLQHRHAAVSLPTGAGKSFIIEDLVRQHGVKTLIIAPSLSIADQLYEQLLDRFGPKLVGMFGDGKKHAKKQIVVGIDKSLQHVLPGTPHYEDLKKTKLVIVDESHLCPTETLRGVCLGLVADAEFRYFVSATQFRNDGADMLLKGLIGEVVYTKTLEELVAEGFLAEPKYLGLTIQSPTSTADGDYMDLIEEHVYKSSKLAQAMVQWGLRYARTGKKVLILIDRMAQFRMMLPFLPVGSFEFAHGDMSAKEKGEIPQQYWKCDVKNLVSQFNAGKLPLLIGTSCITTGTDLRPTDVIIYVMGGQSEIKVRQAIGRGTRLVPGKTSFLFVDFDVQIPGCPPMRNVLHRHFKQRCDYYGKQVPMIDVG